MQNIMDKIKLLRAMTALAAYYTYSGFDQHSQRTCMECDKIFLEIEELIKESLSTPKTSGSRRSYNACMSGGKDGNTKV